VGRLYGDDRTKEGDAFLWKDGKRVPIPTARGVRSMTAADLDGDGKDEVLLADGWAQNYGRDGRAYLTEARWDGKRFQTRRLAQIPGEFSIDEILVRDLDRDGKPEILALGSSTLHLYRRGSAGDWQDLLLARNVRGISAGDLDGDGIDEVLVGGKDAGVIGLKEMLARKQP
jgi:hypothetical protein